MKWLTNLLTRDKQCSSCIQLHCMFGPYSKQKPPQTCELREILLLWGIQSLELAQSVPLRAHRLHVPSLQASATWRSKRQFWRHDPLGWASALPAPAACIGLGAIAALFARISGPGHGADTSWQWHALLLGKAPNHQIAQTSEISRHELTKGAG